VLRADDRTGWLAKFEAIGFIKVFGRLLQQDFFGEGDEVQGGIH
jgi:hypothetical protein